jgi:hypothetical protein
MWSHQETERYLMQLVCDEAIPINYGALYPHAGVDAEDIGSRTVFHNLLGDISKNHYARGLPILSVIVITQEGLPGKGFFNLACDLNSNYVGVSNTEIYIIEFKAVQAHIDKYKELLD